MLFLYHLDFRRFLGTVCVSQIPPRDSQFDFQLEMGRDLIEKVLHHTTFTNNGNLFFCFPERWLSQKEQHYFVQLLTKHPSIVKADMTQIDMITMSPLIVSNLYNDDCRCLTLKKHVEGLDKKTYNVLDKLNPSITPAERLSQIKKHRNKITRRNKIK